MQNPSRHQPSTVA